jgi:hypothetical protein
MQPLVRHIPPGSSLSITATCMSGLSRIMASATSMAEPVPITIKSYSFMTKHNHIDTGLFNRKTFSSFPGEFSAREDNIDHYPLAQPVDISKVSPTPSPPESFSTALITGAVISTIITSIGLLVYFKKRKHKIYGTLVGYNMIEHKL